MSRVLEVDHVVGPKWLYGLFDAYLSGIVVPDAISQSWTEPPDYILEKDPTTQIIITFL